MQGVTIVQAWHREGGGVAVIWHLEGESDRLTAGATWEEVVQAITEACAPPVMETDHWQAAIEAALRQVLAGG